MTPADRKALRQSAAVLTSYARGIFESEVVLSGPYKGKVRDEAVRREIAEYRALADHLRAMSRRRVA